MYISVKEYNRHGRMLQDALYNQGFTTRLAYIAADDAMLGWGLDATIADAEIRIGWDIV